RGAKVTRLGELRQGRSERAEGCGGRTDTGACTVSCSTEIPLEVIAQLHRDCPTATTGSRRTR
ncbi:MAG: succinate dehydrogenase/fumarate reductase iron-sulfur subunit, partial [Pseudonocardia sp.]|nr:succinate dehydrogenase/fumarate reductase iron-sulfur subunit [Pseudonocardia sp.]